MKSASTSAEDARAITSIFGSVQSDWNCFFVLFCLSRKKERKKFEEEKPRLKKRGGDEFVSLFVFFLSRFFQRGPQSELRSPNSLSRTASARKVTFLSLIKSARSIGECCRRPSLRLHAARKKRTNRRATPLLKQQHPDRFFFFSSLARSLHWLFLSAPIVSFSASRGLCQSTINRQRHDSSSRDREGNWKRTNSSQEGQLFPPLLHSLFFVLPPLVSTTFFSSSPFSFSLSTNLSHLAHKQPLHHVRRPIHRGEE